MIDLYQTLTIINNRLFQKKTFIVLGIKACFLGLVQNCFKRNKRVK